MKGKVIMRNFLISALVGVLLVVSGCSGGDDSSQSYSEAQKKEANGEIVKVLSDMRKNYDEVEKNTSYSNLSTDKYPPQDGLYWKVIIKDGRMDEFFSIVNFTNSHQIGWIFWNEVIFSTNEKTWKYDIGSGHSGGGKHTEVVWGGKYETLSVPIEKIAPGLKVLINGTNPIIRLQGKEHKYDMKLTDNDLNIINTAMYVYEQSKITGKTINMEESN